MDFVGNKSSNQPCPQHMLYGEMLNNEFVRPSKLL